MNHGLVVTGTALAQIERVRTWYNERVDGLGDEFVDAIGTLLSSIEALPKRFPLIRGTLRQAPMHHFPYVILYQVIPSGIRVLRVVHGKRHPKHRLS